MDNFELKPERKKINWKNLLYNLLTVVVLLGTFYLATLILTIFTNPNSPLNPFPPAPLPTLYQTATPTSTIIPLEPTWTSTPTTKPVPTRTKAPTWTLLPQMVTPSSTTTPGVTSSTVLPISTTGTTSPTTTPVIASTGTTSTPMPASAVITYAASTTFHPDLNCAWMGVAGKVLGPDGTPLSLMEIQVGGTLGGKALTTATTLSGTAVAYGTSGFEIPLGNLPIASTQTLWIQLLDNTAKPLTNKIYFDTRTDCSQNLVMVVFTKNR